MEVIRRGETLWGPEIEVDGKRPAWLADGDLLLYGVKPGYYYCSPTPGILAWEYITHIRLPADHWWYKANYDSAVDCSHGVPINLPCGACSTPTSTKWEYRQLSLRVYSTHDLNEIGKEGWELVSVVTVTPDKHGVVYTFTFKRPLL